jgi:NADH-quinone oxidoreductase subunit M
MGIVLMGIGSRTYIGNTGVVIQMIMHGIISGGMFLSVGIIYERMKTRQIKEISGLIQIMPILGTIMLILNLANIGIPLTAGYPGEILLATGVGERTKVGLILMCVSGGLGTIGTLWMGWRVLFGDVERIKGSRDLNIGELINLGSVGLCVIWLGIWPEYLISTCKNSLLPLVTSSL